ncbi:hypothetical protein BD779DRAFT_1473553 [Infundibulicybe gibba]|nr:hypothetical protein BD779DRAFT_1473553 [Infundibulicybe gibba]
MTTTLALHRRLWLADAVRPQIGWLAKHTTQGFSWCWTHTLVTARNLELKHHCASQAHIPETAMASTWPKEFKASLSLSNPRLVSFGRYYAARRHCGLAVGPIGPNRAKYMGQTSAAAWLPYLMHACWLYHWVYVGNTGMGWRSSPFAPPAYPIEEGSASATPAAVGIDFAGFPQAADEIEDTCLMERNARPFDAPLKLQVPAQDQLEGVPGEGKVGVEKLRRRAAARRRKKAKRVGRQQNLGVRLLATE